LAWNSVRRNARSLVKWAAGTAASTIGFLEIAPRYEQWKASVWSLTSGLAPSAENVWWDLIRVALVVIGVSIILSDIPSRIKKNFKAEVLEKKSGYHEGDTVRFWAQYAGRLDKGYFLAEVNAPPGTILPNGGQKVQVIDPTTYHSPLVDHGRMGRVSGTNTPPREWGFQIPSNYPTGKSQVVFEVWDGEFGKAKPLGWKEDFFVVESGGRPAEQPTEITNREKEDFKNSVAAEIYFLLKMFVGPLHHWNLDCRSWSSKAEQSKAAILGKEDYLVLRSLYDAIEERNRYFARGSGMSVAEIDPLNRTCVEAFSQAYSEVTWLKISSDTDALLSKARKEVGLP